MGCRADDGSALPEFSLVEETEPIVEQVEPVAVELSDAYIDTSEHMILEPPIDISEVSFNIDRGISHEHSTFPYEARIYSDRILSSYRYVELRDNTIMLGYFLRMYYDSDMEYQFYIAGLFTMAQRNGILTNDRLWASDESGEPKLFSINDFETRESFPNFGWLQVFFYGEYAGEDLPTSFDNIVWLDEVAIIICTR